MYVGREGTCIMDGVTFQFCVANGNGSTDASGGALYGDTNSTLIITRSAFLNNTARLAGGAIYAAWRTMLISVTNTLLVGNEAQGTDLSGCGGDEFTFFVHFHELPILAAHENEQRT